MARYILKRLLLCIPVLLGVMVVIFAITYFTPGEPAYTVLGATATEEDIAKWHAEVGLDQPFFVQLFTYLKGILLHFDFGNSYVNGTSVIGAIWERMPISIRLGLCSTFFSVLIGIPLGIVAAVKQNSAYDYCATVIALFGSAMPNFWLALILMIIFCLWLGWFPASGLGTLRHWVLPCLTAAVFPVAIIMRTTRSSVLEVIRQDYVTTARAKGQSERKIILKHVLRNSMIPVVTVVGHTLSIALTGSLIIETVFSFPGLGLLLSQAISYRNYPIIRGCTIIYAIVVCVMNLLVDIVYTIIDPRIRTQFFAGKKKKAASKKKGEVTDL